MELDLSDPMAANPEDVIALMIDTLADWYRSHPMSDDEASILCDLAETAQRLVDEHDRQHEKVGPSLCLDCSAVVLDEDGGGEWFMVDDDVWNAVMPDDPGDMTWFLCIGCLEQRLGRQLTSADFTDAIANAMSLLVSSTDRLVDRLTSPELSPAMRRSIDAMRDYIDGPRRQPPDPLTTE